MTNVTEKFNGMSNLNNVTELLTGAKSPTERVVVTVKFNTVKDQNANMRITGVVTTTKEYIVSEVQAVQGKNWILNLSKLKCLMRLKINLLRNLYCQSLKILSLMI